MSKSYEAESSAAFWESQDFAACLCDNCDACEAAFEIGARKREDRQEQQQVWDEVAEKAKLP